MTWQTTLSYTILNARGTPEPSSIVPLAPPTIGKKFRVAWAFLMPLAKCGSVAAYARWIGWMASRNRSALTQRGCRLPRRLMAIDSRSDRWAPVNSPANTWMAVWITGL